MTYTESQIHTLSGDELGVAVCKLVLKDDLTANTPERIGESCCRWLLIERCEWRPEIHKHFRVHQADYDQTISCFAWTHREGQPWQASLEEFVRNWRAKPRPMPVDWCMKELMRDEWNLQRWGGHWRVNHPPDNPLIKRWPVQLASSDSLDDPEVAIKRAACIVKLREKPDQSGQDAPVEG